MDACNRKKLSETNYVLMGLPRKKQLENHQGAKEYQYMLVPRSPFLRNNV
jgi:hypothetical protein